MDEIRDKVKAGKIKDPAQIRASLKQAIIDILQPKGSTSELQLGTGKLAVILVIGVNGGGKTTTIGKLAHKLQQGDAKVTSLANKMLYSSRHCVSPFACFYLCDLPRKDICSGQTLEWDL